MKLPLTTLTVDTQLLEFDVWVTASLEDIRDTERFHGELAAVIQIFELLGVASQQFNDVKHCQPSVIAGVFVDKIKSMSVEQALEALQSLSSVLFLVTGKSDNNAKCQFPLFLRDTAHWDMIPTVRRKKLNNVPLPRELKAEKYMGIVASLADYPEHQKRLLEQFISFLLSDNSYVSQLWSIGHSYFMLKPCGKKKDLLTPLVIFQVRGSVAASGGHNPEDMLRQRMKVEWGLDAEVDFNSSDVVLPKAFPQLPGSAIIEPVTMEVEEPQTKTVASIDQDENTEPAVFGTSKESVNKQTRIKTRAYDFVLPYRVTGLQPKIFIQSQFYAGDSGSVSHKNVDQTSASRAGVLDFLKSPDLEPPRFVEYVDGAGYFSSLNGDLKTLLSMPTTASFFQVRSASIRLRREIQHAGFLIPIEVEHAVLRADGLQEEVRRILTEEGYSRSEVERCIQKCVGNGILQFEDGRFSLEAARREVVRRYFLMDVAAIYGSPPTTPEDKMRGSLLVPGFGPFYGTKLDDLAAYALQLAPSLKDDWSDPTIILRDIRWLCDQGMVMSN